MKHILFFACLLVSGKISAQTNHFTDTTINGKIFHYVEQMPEAGYDYNKYISEHLHYPESVRKNYIQGRVIVKFLVREDGSISNPAILRSLDSACDGEALQVIKQMPRWKPGKQNGKAVPVELTLPVVFKLE
jgi:periplasmic protein TonB